MSETPITKVPDLREAEDRIGRIWSQVLEVDHIGKSDNFFELGGSSMDAMVMLKMVEAGLSVEVTLFKFYDVPTLSGLVDHVCLSRSEQEPIEREI